MRVAILCPYSLSVPGGVQGQVLGLARSLRGIGVATRVIGPTDGPPPEPGVVTVGPSVRMDANGSVAPMNVGPVASERTLEAIRPDLVAYLTAEVLGPLPVELRRTARRLAILPYVDGRLATALLDRPVPDRKSTRLNSSHT